MNYAGLIYDDSSHYLDHLAPFCALMDWPLIICDHALAELASRYYPDLKIVVQSALGLKLPSTIVTCDTQPILQAAFPHQKIKTLWLPHGQSDKGSNSAFFQALEHQEIALVYGQKMVDDIHASKVFPKMIRLGNFRWHYFLKHQKFYQKIMPVLEKTNFLYAPTWDDFENNCSFWKAFPKLAEKLPTSCNLLVKLHPNTKRRFEAELEILMGRFANRSNIHFLPEFPPIYPLLNISDAYIGDMSSIGYDFLTLDRPMFFLNANYHFPLHRCGTAILPEDFHFPCGKDSCPSRKELYHYTFEDNPNWTDALRRI